MRNILLLILVCSLAASPLRAGPETASLEDARDALAQWVEVQEILSKERTEWQRAREILDRRISMLEGEIRSLRAKTRELRSGIGEVDEKRGELATEREVLREASRMLEGIVTDLETRVGSLLPRLPEPLAVRVEPLARRIPADFSTTKLSLGERFQNVVGILNEIDKFQQDVVVATEVRALPGGDRAEVEVLYAGLGQAWYVTPQGDLAGVGRPGIDGWEWTPVDGLAPKVTEAIKILESAKEPGWVGLPVEIR